jgi:hypothetical protein
MMNQGTGAAWASTPAPLSNAFVNIFKGVLQLSLKEWA